jgi:transglutaminase-like putative cysteine protease
MNNRLVAALLIVACDLVLFMLLGKVNSMVIAVVGGHSALAVAAISLRGVARTHLTTALLVLSPAPLVAALALTASSALVAVIGAACGLAAMLLSWAVAAAPDDVAAAIPAELAVLFGVAVIAAMVMAPVSMQLRHVAVHLADAFAAKAADPVDLSSSELDDQLDLTKHGSRGSQKVTVAYAKFDAVDVLKLPQQLYLRERAFTAFDGRRWTHSGGRGFRADPDDGTADEWVRMRHPTAKHKTMTYTVFVPSPKNGYVFAVPNPTRINVDKVADLGSDTFFLPNLTGEPIKYNVESEPSFFNPLAVVGLTPGAGSKEATQLPDIALMDAIESRVEEAVGTETDPTKMVSRLLEYFAANHRYTESNAALGDKPLTRFIEERKPGNCSVYATAFVLHLRAAGLPARLSIGYLSGRFDSAEKAFVFRAADYHAWAEVYDAKQGWLVVDPTPGPSQVQETAANGIRDGDPEETAFADLSQPRLPPEAGADAGIDALAFDPGVRFDFTPFKFAALVVLALLLLGIPLLRRTLDVRQATRPVRSAAAGPVTDYFDRFQRCFKERGLPRRRGETGREYFRRLRKAAAIDDSWRDLVDYYYAVSYENQMPSHPQEEEFLSRINGLGASS